MSPSASRPSPRRPLADSLAVHDQVYEAIRQALINGRIAPGVGVSLRSLAAQLGVSPMPVRDAVRRLAAERALAINPANKRLSVPSLTAGRLEQLSQARLWIEPELAARAAPRADAALIKRLRERAPALPVVLDPVLASGRGDAL
ncbi:GntR family transcriptional regulator, partial [Caulobacter sp.]|uniref:GntR family transcriptional regulator n=1 Tax=Caulobacter sp. TaxID=78 RepID=UPI003BAE5D6D